MIEHYFVVHMEEMLKSAEEKPKKVPSVPRVIGEGLLGLGTGMLAGYGAGRVLQKKLPQHVPYMLPKITGTAGALMGVTYPMWKAEERAAIQRALEARRQRLEEKRRRSAG